MNASGALAMTGGAGEYVGPGPAWLNLRYGVAGGAAGSALPGTGSGAELLIEPVTGELLTGNARGEYVTGPDPVVVPPPLPLARKISQLSRPPGQVMGSAWAALWMIPHRMIPKTRGFAVDIANLLCEPNEIAFLATPTATVLRSVHAHDRARLVNRPKERHLEHGKAIMWDSR